MAEKGNIAEIKSVGEHLVYETQWLDFYHDDIEHPDGSPGTYAWVKGHSGNDAVMTIPVTSSERYLLIRVYRHLSKRNLWEFPAGLIENCEPPLEAARRELIEETGITPDSVELLGPQVPVAGFAGGVFHLTLAVIPEIEISDVKLQAEEGIVDAKLLTRRELIAMLASEDVGEGVTLTCLARYWAYRELKSAEGTNTTNRAR